jgi:hypothetical protein
MALHTRSEREQAQKKIAYKHGRRLIGRLNDTDRGPIFEKRTAVDMKRPIDVVFTFSLEAMA